MPSPEQQRVSKRHVRLVLLAAIAGIPWVAPQAANVSGTVYTTFQNSAEACSASTALALRAAVAAAASNVTRMEYTVDAVPLVVVDVCSSRRLDTERRLATVAAAAAFTLTVASASLAAFVSSSVAAATADFASVVSAEMAASGVALAGTGVGALTSSASLAIFASFRNSVLGTFAADAAGAVGASRWRLVGRSVAQAWTLSVVRFFEDAGCTSAIPVLPRRELQASNGRAFSGPHKRRHVGFSAADAFVDNGIDWSSGVGCGDASDSCHVGFEWMSDHVDPGRVSTGLLQRSAVSPRCITLEQSSVAGRFAPTVVVQCRPAGSLQWTSHLVRAGLVGGTITLRLPTTAQ